MFKSRNVRATLIFALFTLNLFGAKLKIYIYYTSVYLWQNSLKSRLKNPSEFAKNWLTANIFTCENYHFYSIMKIDKAQIKQLDVIREMD